MACGTLIAPFGVIPTLKNPINTRNPINKERLLIPPPQLSASTKIDLEAFQYPVGEGRSSPVAIFIIPVEAMMRREYSTLGAEGMYQ